ncbi:DNA transposase [Frankliniella fusca]|uniref:DNA transposase n=1 Tax=Frankliniella fusca TaxID=407009 RepID=A0AAE1LKQ1_9NEOP|nr:DNA transposase [Frankliniella fusca]
MPGRTKKGLSSKQKCWAALCGTNKVDNPDLTFHSFPANVELCWEWVRLSGHSLLCAEEHKKLMSCRALCSKHFTRDQYAVPRDPASLLNRNAKPSIFTQPPVQIMRPGFLGVFLDENGKPSFPPPVPLRKNTRIVTPVVASHPNPVILSNMVAPAAPAAECEPDHVFLEPTPQTECLGPNKRKSCVLSSIENIPKRRRCLDFGSALSPAGDNTAAMPASSATPAFGDDIGPELLSTPLPSPRPTASRELFCDTPVPIRSSSTATSQQLGSNSRGCKYTNVLTEYNLFQQDITPKKKRLVEGVKLLKRKVSNLERSLLARKENNKALQKFCNGPSISKLKTSLKTKEGVILMEAQFANKGSKKNGFRWTLEQKTLGLALYKASRKSYSFLRKILNLPSRSTLLALMAKLVFETGINKSFFTHLKEVIKDFSPRDRACILMWDEVHLAQSLNYNEAKDAVEGWVKHSEGETTKQVANKALTFMVQSLTKKWKQPVAYYFSHGETPANMLAELIVGVTGNLQEAGFDIRASVSDQGGNNLKAVRLLRSPFTAQSDLPGRKPLCADCKKKKTVVSKAKKKAEKDGTKLKGDDAYFSLRNCSVCRLNSVQPAVVTHYRINNNNNIYHFWDVPHLLKMLRTNFQKYNVNFAAGKTACWDHITSLRDENGHDGTFFHVALKLTDHHLKLTHNQDKMKVSLAAQVLSNRVATTLIKIAEWNESTIPGCRATGEFVYFVDQLFDSFNGSSKRRHGKKLRVNLSDHSPHFDFWEMAAINIRKWWFINSPKVFSSTKGWLENITAIKGLWHDLKRDFDLQYLNLRRLNQDPLENLFSVIKANGHKVPTVPQYISAIKTSIITNLRNSGIRGANCEEDGGELLTDLNVFFGLVTRTAGAGADTSSPSSLDLFSSDISDAELMTTAEEQELLSLTKAPIIHESVEVDVEQQQGSESDDMFEELFGGDFEGDEQPEEEDEISLHSLSRNMTFLTVGNVPKCIQKPRRKKKAAAPEPSEEELIRRDLQRENTSLLGNRRKITAYVTGFIVRKVCDRVKCDVCAATLLADELEDDHELILAFEYDKTVNKLTYARTQVIDFSVSSVNMFLEIMHTSFHMPGLMKLLFNRITSVVDFSSFGCLAHKEEVKRLMLLYFCRVSIHHRCRILNREFAKNWQNTKTVGSLPASSSQKQKGTQPKKKPSQPKKTPKAKGANG